MKEFASIEWGRAKRALDSARQIAENDPDSAASRAYYAAFHALSAFFALRGQTFTKHTEIRSALHRDLVRPGLLDSEMGKAYDFLMDLRETGDYGGTAQVSAASARLAVDKAARFIAGVARVSPDLG